MCIRDSHHARRRPPKRARQHRPPPRGRPTGSPPSAPSVAYSNKPGTPCTVPEAWRGGSC
eukprot:9535236-Alexandrium_andersonii.AAC.1